MSALVRLIAAWFIKAIPLRDSVVPVDGNEGGTIAVPV